MKEGLRDRCDRSDRINIYISLSVGHMFHLIPSSYCMFLHMWNFERRHYVTKEDWKTSVQSMQIKTGLDL